jgi:hypothetical protein
MSLMGVENDFKRSVRDRSPPFVVYSEGDTMNRSALEGGHGQTEPGMAVDEVARPT